MRVGPSIDPRSWIKDRGPIALGFLVIVLPVLWFGPWIPFVDLIAFVGLYSYPVKLSYGPFHYYVFQFTYILPSILSRLFVDFGVGVATQTSLFYLGQALTLFCVIWKLLRLLLPTGLYRDIFTVLAALAFWDGLFLWGGPLGFSAAAVLLSIVVYLTVRDAGDAHSGSSWPVCVLTLLAVASHPFAVPFACVVFAVRLLFLPRARWHSAGMILLLFLCQTVIKQENPNYHFTTVGVLDLFRLFPVELWNRLRDLFSSDIQKVGILFGVEPILLSIYFKLLGTIHLIGFITCPLVAFLAKDKPSMRVLATLNTAVAGMYLFSRENDAVITLWPQRILFFYSYITYAAGVAAACYLVNRYLLGRLRGRLFVPQSVRNFAVILLAVWLFLSEVPILRLGDTVHTNYFHLRDMILASGVHDAVLISNKVNIAPWYLRGVPFLLFSDEAVLKRNLIFYTEWHAWPHQPTRVAEMGLPGGRPRYKVDFEMKDGLVSLQLVPER